ncbi:BON domain-containing protein [Legionella bononiensis]|uniref:BON domain-containing protein n=1 Tax=Legionella bononiensis TaxID=2793102 RepID=A0ABS1WFK0_9GAMM|nr:BON domain-containing protein [Legionella bononiensis]MBL7481586.1 BON domain-containing protein [Legionella bononiensis]MBL7528133.1 BON domain-containing protein [Legionella bononiensis]MBL7562609.1 BON domain-containing protein [Legionella bononiensis]
MRKQGRFILVLLLMVCSLSGCIGTVWTGATLLYDRHDVYKKLNDYNLLAEVNRVLAVNRTFNNSSCVLDIAAFNGDILIAGHVPNNELLEELKQRLTQVKHYRRLFNEVHVRQISSNSVEDSWITTKIRSQIFADDSIDPDAFKIITSDRIVYLMGDVKPDQAAKVIKIARYTTGVERVVKMMRYFTYQSVKQA